MNDNQELAEIDVIASRLVERVRDIVGRLERLEQPSGRRQRRSPRTPAGPAGNEPRAQTLMATVKKVRRRAGAFLSGLTVDQETPPPVIAFVHIPKTAGGTVKSMFSAAYTNKRVQDAGNYMRNAEGAIRSVSKGPDGWRAWSRSGKRVTIGHLPYGLFKDHLPQDTRYLTFLREPVDRVLSHYFRHIQRRPWMRPVSGSAKAPHRVRTDSLEEALVERRLPQVNNLMTRFLCSRTSQTDDLPPGALEEAKANLQTFAFIGLQERFDESLVLLQRLFGFDALPRENRHVNAYRPTVDEIREADRALVLEHNQLDVELYAFGRTLFEEAVAAAGPGLAEDVETLRARIAAARAHGEPDHSGGIGLAS